MEKLSPYEVLFNPEDGKCPFCEGELNLDSYDGDDVYCKSCETKFRVYPIRYSHVAVSESEVRQEEIKAFLEERNKMISEKRNKRKRVQ